MKTVQKVQKVKIHRFVIALISASIVFTTVTWFGVRESTASIIRNPPVVAVGGTSAVLCDLKDGYQLADHSGWYLANGRSNGSLPSVPLTNLQSVCQIPQMPDLRDRGTIGAGLSFPLRQLGGGASITIAQANIPNYTMSTSLQSVGTPSGTVSVVINAGGSHSHTTNIGTATNANFTGSQFGYTNFGSGTQSLPSNSAGSHSHSTSASFTGNSLGQHNHTVNSGGSGVPIDIRSPFQAVNKFIYLGV